MKEHYSAALEDVLFYSLVTPDIATPSFLKACYGDRTWTLSAESDALEEVVTMFTTHRRLFIQSRCPALTDPQLQRFNLLLEGGEELTAEKHSTLASWLWSQSQTAPPSPSCTVRVAWPPVCFHADAAQKVIELQLVHDFSSVLPFSLAQELLAPMVCGGARDVRCMDPGGLNGILKPNYLRVRWTRHEHDSADTQDCAHAEITLVALECWNWLHDFRSAGLQLYGALCAAELHGGLNQKCKLPLSAVNQLNGGLHGTLDGLPLTFTIHAEVWGNEVKRIPLLTLRSVLRDWLGMKGIETFFTFAQTIPRAKDIPALRNENNYPFEKAESVVDHMLPWLSVYQRCQQQQGYMYGWPKGTSASPLPPPHKPFFAVILVPSVVRETFVSAQTPPQELPKVIICYPNPKGTMIYVYDEEALEVLFQGLHILKSFAVVFDDTQREVLLRSISTWCAANGKSFEEPRQVVTLLPALHQMNVELSKSTVDSVAIGSTISLDSRRFFDAWPLQAFAFSLNDVLIRQHFDVCVHPFCQSTVQPFSIGEGDSDAEPQVVWRVCRPPLPFLSFMLERIKCFNVEHMEKLAMYLHQAIGKAILMRQRREATR